MNAADLLTCPRCGRGNFTKPGLARHVCRASNEKDNPSMASKTNTRDPADLKPHPLFAKTHHPMMPKDSPEWASLVGSVREHGVLEAVKITESGLIVDGRHRAAAAAEAGLDAVQVVVVPEDQAAWIIATTLTQRRHYNKAARAYLMAPFADEAAKEGKKARSANLLNNSPSVENFDNGQEGAPKSLEEFADKVGISRDYLIKARDVHARLDRLGEKVQVEDPETKEKLAVRDYVNRMLLSYGTGFQPVLAMLGYLAAGNRPAGQDLKDARAQYGRLAAEKIKALTANFRTWDKADAVEKEILYAEIPKQVAQWPTDVARRLFTALAARRDEWNVQN